jgi:hypothetical protein
VAWSDRKRVVPAAILVGIGIAALIIWHRGSPVWCRPDGRCAPTETFAPGNYPIEYRSDCPRGHTMIQYGIRGYIRDPDQSPSRAFDVSYDADATLPSDAQNTTWTSEGREFWVSPSLRDSVSFTSIFIVYEDHVERWPWLPIGCQ